VTTAFVKPAFRCFDVSPMQTIGRRPAANADPQPQMDVPIGLAEQLAPFAVCAPTAILVLARAGG
jgi:hypothetical protein